MLDKIWRFLKTSPQDSNAPSPPTGVPPTLTDVEKGKGEEEVYREAKVWYYRGNEQYNLGDFEEAIADYDKALELKPDYHEAWYWRGNALRNLGRPGDAIASFDKALEFKPDYHEAWNNRGYALGSLGRLEDAIASYDKALEFKPDYHEAWIGRGMHRPAS